MAKGNSKPPAGKPGQPDESDIAERTAAFNAGVQELGKKYELAIGAQPGITPDGRIGARAIVMSTRGKPKEPVNPPAKIAEA